MFVAGLGLISVFMYFRLVSVRLVVSSQYQRNWKSRSLKWHVMCRVVY